jgi:hypothetical protein
MWMLRKLIALGPVFLTLSLFDVACMSTKDTGAVDGGNPRRSAGDSSARDKDATAGTGGSAGSKATGSGGSSTSAGGSSPNGGAFTTDSGTNRDSSATSNPRTPHDSGTTNDSAAPHDSGTTDNGANNFLIDPGFEEVALEPWLSNGSDLVLEHVDPHSGKQHAALENAYTDPSPLDEKMTQGVNLLAPGTYTFRIWIKKAGTGSLTALRVIAEGFNYMDLTESRDLDILQDVTGTYQLFTLTGIPVTTAGANVGHCTVAVAASGDENAKVYLDDAALTKEH